MTLSLMCFLCLFVAAFHTNCFVAFAEEPTMKAHNGFHLTSLVVVVLSIVFHTLLFVFMPRRTETGAESAATVQGPLVVRSVQLV